MKQLDPKAVWLFFIGNSFGFVVGTIVLWLGFKEFFELEGSVLSIFIIGILVLAYVVAKLTYHYYRYEMSEPAFRKEHGIIWKRYVSIPYDKIQNVDIHRGIMARLLGLSDLQIQTAGGISAGSYGAFSEGRLIGVSKEDAEKLRDELIQRARSSRSNQGL